MTTGPLAATRMPRTSALALLLLVVGCAPPVPHAGPPVPRDAGPGTDTGTVVVTEELPTRGPVSASTPSGASGGQQQSPPLDCVPDGTYRVLALVCERTIVGGPGATWTFSNHGTLLRTSAGRIATVECERAEDGQPEITIHGNAIPLVSTPTSTWSAIVDGPRCLVMTTTQPVDCAGWVATQALIDFEGPI